jgi:hypothetical protein
LSVASLNEVKLEPFSNVPPDLPGLLEAVAAQIDWLARVFEGCIALNGLGSK